MGPLQLLQQSQQSPSSCCEVIGTTSSSAGACNIEGLLYDMERLAEALKVWEKRPGEAVIKCVCY